MNTFNKIKVGILGCGNISDHYFKGCLEVFKDTVEVIACADKILEKAEQAAKKWNINACTCDQLLNNSNIDLIVNLTIPAVHEQINIAILSKGKHLYSEKPLSMTREGAEKIYNLAKESNLRVGVAPDTFMSAPVQTAKKLLEENIIGDVIGVNAICPLRGNELWRPDCEFFYQKGGGPIFDMAPYYLNIMINLFGSFKNVVANGKISWAERIYECELRKGDKISVEIPTHVAGIFELENGILFNFTNSFDIYKSCAPYVEIYGKDGTLTLPFPNLYKGDVMVSLKGEEFKAEQQLSGYDGFMRGAGIADMAKSIYLGIEHLASIEMALHVTDIMLAFSEAIESGNKININTKCEKPSGMWEREVLI